MYRKVVLCFALIGLAAMASAKSYTVKLFAPATAGTVLLKAGEYKVEISGDTATLSGVPMKVQTVDTKYPTTTVRLEGGDGAAKRIQEIRLGGTKLKLVFSTSSATE